MEVKVASVQVALSVIEVAGSCRAKQPERERVSTQIESSEARELHPRQFDTIAQRDEKRLTALIVTVRMNE